MIEGVKELFLSGEIIGWLILAVMAVVLFRMILKTGALLLSLVLLGALGFVLFRFFPAVPAPLLELFRGVGG